ncbi:hypothetical protein EKO04_004689 [Ascochyta lentis]|uniref:Uncharacterized protein n=1 Tax=Ascochyta lentis TaxID=205686 RepID=A0A8H7J2E8_9PLEO|nr:hypothetical protein EKO04_004689 [Ascochyta lentis]
MSTRNLLRHIFRHGPRDKVSEDAMPLGLGKSRTELTGICVDNISELEAFHNNQDLAVNTPEPFGLEDIAEEDGNDTTSQIDTASLTETLASLDLEISTFSTRELVHATLDEAKMAAEAHLDTIHTMMALLDALDGFSATISELKKETLEKKQACDEKMGMLDAVERAVEGMSFAGELREQGVVSEAAN